MFKQEPPKVTTGSDRVLFTHLSLCPVGLSRVCEGGGDLACDLACCRFHDLHRGAALPGVGPVHREQHPVGEHAQPSGSQQSPVEEPAVQAAQTQGQRPGLRGPHIWDPGADGRRHALRQPGLQEQGHLTAVATNPPLWASNATRLPLTASLRWFKCTEAIVTSALAAEMSGFVLSLELILGRLPQPKRPGVRKRCFCHVPLWPLVTLTGSSSYVQSILGFAIRPPTCMTTPAYLELQDWSSCQSTNESERESTFYFNNNYYYKIIMNLFNFSILCTRQWV